IAQLRRGHEGLLATGPDEVAKRLGIAVATPKIGLEAFDDPLRLNDLHDRSVRNSRPRSTGMAGSLGSRRDILRVPPFGDHAPEASLDSEPGFDEQMDCVVRHWPLMRKVGVHLAPVIAPSLDGIVRHSLGE